MVVEEYQGLPARLADMAPGPRLGAILASVDRDRLSGHNRVLLLKAHHRQVSHYQSELYADMMAVVESSGAEFGPDELPEDIQDAAASEIRAALTWTRRATEYQLGFASDLVERLPMVREALLKGGIDVPKARIIINHTLHLEEETARTVAKAALERASGQTTGELSARIARLVITVDPESAKTRYEQGVEGRRMTSQANPDGTTNLYGLDLPVDEANTAMRRINQLARAAKSIHDDRSIDQIRADVFLDLLNGRNQKHDAKRTKGVVDIRVDLSTLAGLDEHPGELNGYGPVIADIARRVVETSESEHRVTVTDPDTREVLWGGTTRRRPTAGLKRHVETQNPTCTFPGCRMPAIDCDIDHNLERSKGGRTDPANLAPLCRHDHVIRHKGWKIRRLRPGTYQFISPLGHIYTTGPDP